MENDLFVITTQGEQSLAINLAAVTGVLITMSHASICTVGGVWEVPPALAAQVDAQWRLHMRGERGATYPR